MKTLINFILFVSVSCLFLSCQKELSIDSSLPSNGDNNGNSNGNNSGNTSIIGDWSFIALDMDVEVTGQATDISLGTVRFVNTYKTTTINNKGSLKITANEFQSTDLSYSISTEASVSTIVPGLPPDQQKIPFTFDMPASSSSGKYQQIGNDSLYFPDGAIISIPDASGDMPSSISGEPSGAKFTIVSDTLKIFGGIDASSVQNVQGLDFSVNQKASVILKYKRK